MKRKRYLYISIVLFILSITLLGYRLEKIGIFDKNKIVLRALSCDECADYGVVIGESKLAAQLQEPSANVNIYQVYVTGELSPAAQDYTKTYDYYAAVGRISALQKSKDGKMVFPVINVIEWDHLKPSHEWLLIGISFLIFILSVHYLIRFRIANRPDATIAVLKTHSDPPKKKN